ncbi:MAG: DotH/IcmK family type IV secretion protein [Gammaproteobacteria bacterium]|nr:DotH/IcmK family type IV secretion protein [Gammaproteobacteria bacterium]
MMKIRYVVILGLSLMSGSALAAGFGVAGEQTTQPTASMPSVSQSDGAKPLSIEQLLAKARANGEQIGDSNNQLPASTATHANTAVKVAPSTQQTGSSVGQSAFSGVVNSMLPMTPEQIKTLRYMFDQSQRAASSYPGTPPKPTSSSVMVNLSPGSAPPIIRLRSGFVSSLVFLDSTGQPWPVQAYDLGDPSSFNVQWDQKGNTLLVQALSSYKPGNLAVMLKGQDTPVMVTLMPGQKAVDYRVDLRVPGMGPNAQPQFSNLPDVASPQLLDFLNGVPPNGAKELQVTGAPCEAWLLNGKMYLRTSLTVLSPSWLATMASPDGTHVFELMKAPVVLASYRGKVVQLSIEGL